MTMAQRNSYLTSKAFKIYLSASILTALSSMLGNIVDSIIVSNLVSHDAMSAVSLARPLIQLYYTVYLLFGLGGSLLVAYAMGKNDKAAANRTFSLVTYVLVGFSLIITVIGVARAQIVVDLFCTSEEVYQYALEYFRPVLWGSLFYFGSYFLGTYTTIDGSPRLVSFAMIADNIVNLLCDILLIKCFDMGTGGSSIASLIGHVVGIAIMALPYMRGKSSFRLVKVKFNGMIRSIAEIARSGAPFAVASICLTVYMYTANIIIQDNFGAAGIYIFSVMLSLLTFYNFFLAGACNTLQSLGALLVGMGDIVGLRLSVNAAFKFLIASLAVCCGILWIAPGFVCKMFGCPDELLSECCYACRIYAAAFVFFCIIYLLMVNYKLLKHEALSNFLSFALSLSVIPVMWIIAIYAPKAIWWSNLIAYVLVFAILLVWSECQRKNGASHITLQPVREQYPTLDFSVEYSNIGLEDALTCISNFLDDNKVSEERKFGIKLSAEELLKNVIEHSHDKIKGSPYIDMRLSVLTDGSVIFTLRDDGKPFDPLSFNAANEGFGLKLATAFNQKLSYKYMFGQNISTIEF